MWEIELVGIYRSGDAIPSWLFNMAKGVILSLIKEGMEGKKPDFQLRFTELGCRAELDAIGYIT